MSVLRSCFMLHCPCRFLIATSCLCFSFFVSALAQRPTYGGPLKPEQANVDIRHYTIYERHFRESIAHIKNDKPVVLGKGVTEDEAYQGDIYSKGAVVGSDEAPVIDSRGFYLKKLIYE